MPLDTLCLSKNVRADYLKAFWNVVNWSAVDQWNGLIKRNAGLPHRNIRAIDGTRPKFKLPGPPSL